MDTVVARGPPVEESMADAPEGKVMRVNKWGERCQDAAPNSAIKKEDALTCVTLSQTKV